MARGAPFEDWPVFFLSVTKDMLTADIAGLLGFVAEDYIRARRLAKPPLSSEMTAISSIKKLSLSSTILCPYLIWIHGHGYATSFYVLRFCCSSFVKAILEGTFTIP
jgi:hypothetical protein